MRRDLRRITAALAAGWLVVGALAYVAGPLFSRLDGSPAPLPPIHWSLLAWGLRAALTPLYIAVMVRYPFTRARFVRRLVQHIAFCFGLNIIHTALYLAVRLSFEDLVPLHILHIAETFAQFAVLHYAVVAAAVVLIHQQRQARLGELTRARLERRLAVTRLDRAIASVDPNGIVASLDEIDARIAADPAAAEGLIHTLSERLRRTLRQSRARTSGANAPADVDPARPWDRRGVRAAAFAVYPAFALCWAAFELAYDGISGVPTDWLDLGRDTVGYLIAAAMWPFLVLLCSHVLSDRANWKRNMFLLTAGGLVAAIGTEAAAGVLRTFAISPSAGRNLGPALYLSFIAANVLQIGRYGERRASESLRAQSVIRDMKQAQLRTLRTQLAPHFLFNALNSILCLLAKSPGGARAMLAQLRRTLEMTFRLHTREEVTLAEDLELTASYIDIERVRFRDAIDVHVDIDPDLLDVVVPSFLLQPLVENAIRHGALASEGRGTIALRAKAMGERMEIRVENECDLLETGEWREGVGLSNIRQRLDHLYGHGHELAIEAMPGRGFQVIIRMPRKRKM